MTAGAGAELEAWWRGFVADGRLPEALQLVLDGVELRGATLRPWYERDD